MRRLFARLGALRIAMGAAVLLVALMAPFSGLETDYHDLALFPAVIAPVLAVLLFFGLLLDMLMGAVMMAEAREKYKTVLKADALWLLVLLASWGPFYLSLLSAR